MNKSSGSYSEQFKPALALGSPTLTHMSNQTYLWEQQESYDDRGQVCLHSSRNENDPSLKTIFRLLTTNESLNPSVRKVSVMGKSGFESFLVETLDGEPGICVIMFQDKGSQVYCNIRYLPVSTVNDVVSGMGPSGPVQVKIPKNNVVKLNITLEASTTGEVVYKTHKTEISLEDITDAEKVQLKRDLEFKAAEMAAHYSGQLVKTSPLREEWHPQAVAGPYDVQCAGGIADWITENKRCILTCTAIATGVGVIVGGVGILASIPGVAVSGAILAAIGGLGRNAVGLAAPQTVIVGKTYTCQWTDEENGLMQENIQILNVV